MNSPFFRSTYIQANGWWIEPHRRKDGEVAIGRRLQWWNPRDLVILISDEIRARRYFG